MEALGITYLFQCVSFVDDLQVPNKRTKSVDLRCLLCTEATARPRAATHERATTPGRTSV